VISLTGVRGGCRAWPRSSWSMCQCPWRASRADRHEVSSVRRRTGEPVNRQVRGGPGCDQAQQPHEVVGHAPGSDTMTGPRLVRLLHCKERRSAGSWLAHVPPSPGSPRPGARCRHGLAATAGRRTTWVARHRLRTPQQERRAVTAWVVDHGAWPRQQCGLPKRAPGFR
jgi:hypothetical protein